MIEDCNFAGLTPSFFPPAPDFPAFEINETAPYSINGQRVTINFNGMNVSWAVGGAMLLPNLHGSLGLDLLEFSAMMSQRQIGTRIRGVRWGHSFTAEYGTDGSRNIWWGDYNESLRDVSYGIEAPIYDSNWSAINRLDLFPGFDKRKHQIVKKAIDGAKSLFSKNECKEALQKAGVDIAKLGEALNGLSARSVTDTESKGFNVFYAETSTEPNVLKYLKTPESRGSAALVLAYRYVMVQDGFFNARGGARIGIDASRAIAMLHEAIHLTGKRDEDFGSSRQLNETIIDGCYSRMFGHNDLALVVN